MSEEVNERERLFGLYSEEVVRAAEALAGYGFPLDDLMEATRRILNAISEVWESLKTLVEQVKDVLSIPQRSTLERLWLAHRRTADRQRQRVKIKLCNERAKTYAAQRKYRPP